MFIPIEQLTKCLEAMYFTFSPYLDYESLDDYPWIRDLMKEYSNIIYGLDSQGIVHYFERIIIS